VHYKQVNGGAAGSRPRYNQRLVYGRINGPLLLRGKSASISDITLISSLNFSVARDPSSVFVLLCCEETRIEIDWRPIL